MPLALDAHPQGLSTDYPIALNLLYWYVLLRHGGEVVTQSLDASLSPKQFNLNPPHPTPLGNTALRTPTVLLRALRVLP